MSIPTSEEFASHGLLSVVLDQLDPSSSASTSSDRETRITGVAMLKPVEGYPLGERWRGMSAGEVKKVRFRLAPASNPAGLEHFRRNHQLATALYSQTSTLHPVAGALSNPCTPRAERSSSPSPPPFPARSSLLPARSFTKEASSEPPPGPQWPRSPFYPYIDRIIAWWEDSFGAWMIIEEGEEGEIVSLEEYWSTIMERGGKKDGMEGLLISEKDRAKEEMRVYGEATEVLIQVAEILLGLNERRLALAVARPEFFHVNTNPVPTSTNFDSEPLPPQVELIRVATAVQLPGFTWENLQAPTYLTTASITSSVEGSPTPSSSLSDIASFTEPTVKRARDPDGAAGGLYEEKLLKKHLRYLAPETVSSRRVSPVGDVFSFGVLAYELLVGRKMERNDNAELDLLSDVHRHLTSDLPSPLSVLNHSTSPSNEFYNPLTPTNETRRPFLLPPRQLSDIIVKSIAKDLDERYAGVRSLLFDLRRFRDICRAEGDLSKFVVGEVDSLSRFNLPKELISRSTEVETLEKAFQAVVGTGAGSSTQTEGLSGRGGKSLKVLNVWGVSGSGKSRMVEVWAKGLELRKDGPLVGFAKLDQHLRKPLTGFVQLLQSLLDRVFSDPKENAQVWREKILHALSAQGAVFLSLISPEWRNVLAPDDDSVPARPVTSDWELFLPGFRVWSKTLLQLFATPERPLLLILDDIQWLPVEELKLWQDIIDSPLNPFENVLLVSLFRVEQELPPPSSSLLSKSSQNLKISRFGEGAVSEFLSSSFHWEEGIASASILASFLWTETQGSPFYLKSLVTSMVRDGTIAFSFEYFRWTVDLPSLQRHASEGIDSYLDRVLVALPENVQVILRILSCLPSTGFDIESLVELADSSRRETENALHTAALCGAVLFLSEGRVRFTHDRNQAAAYRLLPPNLRGLTHSSIAKYLQQPSHIQTHLFDAADNELLAIEFGMEVEHEDELVRLVLKAAQQAARSASYHDSSKYLEACERIANFGDKATWDRSRESCFFFVQIFAEVSAVLRNSDLAITRIRAMLPFCSTSLEEINLQTLVVRLLISGNRYADAVTEATAAIRRASFDPLDPPAHLLERIPTTPQQVLEFADALLAQPDDEVTPQTQLLEAVALLIGYVGPSVYITQPADVRKPYFSLGAALCFSSPSQLRADSSSYILAVYSLSVCDDMESRKSFVSVSHTIAELRPDSFFFSAGIVVALLQSHGWVGLDELDSKASYDSAMSTMNTDVATYIISLDFESKLFSRRSFSSHLPAIKDFYSGAIEAMTPAARVLIEIPLQAGEVLGCIESVPEDPWNFDGAFLRAKDYEVIRDFPMHSVTWWVNALRVAILFGAKEEVLSDLVSKMLVNRAAVPGLVTELELLWLLSIYYLVYGDDSKQAEVEANITEIRRYSASIDYRARLQVLEVARAIRVVRSGGAWSTVITEVESCLSSLLADGFELLAGLASLLTAQLLASIPGGSQRLASGYARTAYGCFLACEAVALARNLYKAFPSAFSSLPHASAPVLPSHVLTISPLPPGSAISIPPPLTSADSNSTEASHKDTSSTAGSDDQVGSIDETLDNLTFMRSSLLLAGERDPEVLVVTLIRILCQFVRADFGAIALHDPTSNSLRLRGAGPYSRLAAFDLDVSHEDAARLAPISYLLHVSRTKKAITSVSSLQKLRNDPFFDRLPRSILVLPLTQQGRYVGVLLLSSKTVITPSSQIPQLTEVVSCLATFAAIALESSQSTAKLESIVSERTARLQDALRAKTTFLSHMSHELRTPLFAVLGLAAVLEDSPGLNSVQRDHLATIRSSGEDLQTLISNVLDYSRLESGSMAKSQLESIAFPLREVVESTLDSVSTISQRKNVELVLATPTTSDPSYSLIGDPFRVKQVLLNLLSNAVKFTSTGSVVVSWELEESDETTVVHVHVKDSGVGIPAQKMDRLFKSFSQIDSSITRSYGGSGLGLAISQSLTQLMGGSCTASSEVGVGSVFSFSFIAGRTSPTASPFPPFPAVRSAFIVSKSEEWASKSVLESHLAAFGFAPVHSATSFSTAMSTSSRPSLVGTPYDVVLVVSESISLKELGKMKEAQPKTKFFYLTRSIDLSNTIQKLSIPHSSIISRPLKASSLYSTLAPNLGLVSLAAPAKSSSGIDKEMARKHPLHILLVDDNQVNCVVGKRILERFGYTDIDTAYDGKMAVEMAEQTRYDLILMDLQMPILDGYAANTRIAASPLAGRPIVVALSANTDDDTRNLVAKEGFFFYLTKPMVLGVLSRVLAEAHTTRVRNQSEGTTSPNRVPSPSKKMRLDPEPRSTTSASTRGGKEVRAA